MARKNFIKKIIGSMLALSLVMSFCVIPHAAADAQNSTASSDDIVYDIDFDRFTAAGGTVDGTKVCGGAYAVESVTQKDGTAMRLKFICRTITQEVLRLTIPKNGLSLSRENIPLHMTIC